MNHDNSSLENPTSFEWIDQVYREYGSFVESTIRYEARDLQEGEDIYQEVFMTLFKVNDPERIKDIKDYLYSLIIRKIHEFRLKKMRHSQTLGAYADFLTQQSSAAASDSVTVRDEAARMLSSIEQFLTKKESQAVILRFSEKTDLEAARAMNINKKSFLRYVSVGVKKIRTIVKRAEKMDA